MSVSTEVQRTLVKSPPELWSELSNPDALARHLGELGQIRITSVEPETTVEWEAEGASGIVQLKQSGWGTKVTLSVTRQAPALEEQVEPELVADAEPTDEAEPATDVKDAASAELAVETELIAGATETLPDEASQPEPVAESESQAMSEIQPEPSAEPASRQGFFARLFRRRRRATQTEATESAPTAAAEPQPEFEALAAPEPIYPPAPAPPAQPALDLAAELASMEAQMEQETTELLTGVLDRLGAAHHRPFSRG